MTCGGPMSPALAMVVLVAAVAGTFCLIEWRFCTPYTVDDLLVRVAAAVVVPPLLGRLTEGPPGPTRVTAWVASTAALGCLVLAVYDAALLYNLGHVARWSPVVVVAGAVIAAGGGPGSRSHPGAGRSTRRGRRLPRRRRPSRRSDV